ncbi:MAG: ADP-ribosylglycohydrolase family protein [Prevotella sp.]|nr:ADP-ribosylglycohydrolase family protein [Prevotella sp.]
MENKDYRLDLVRGSLIGGAAGDALGYPVEFDRYQQIIARYGKRGITQYELRGEVAEISDDTQMTLFTANGILIGLTDGTGATPEHSVAYAYQDWYDTQTKSFESARSSSNRHTWLSTIPALYSRRAPGNTCLTAIHEMINGRTPRNNSKGCGGVMRIAPWPLFCACHEVPYAIEEIDVAGGEIARLTHKHPLGWMPAILLTDMLYQLVREEPLKGLHGHEAQRRFSEIVRHSLDVFAKLTATNMLSEISWNEGERFVDVFNDDWTMLSNLVSNALLLALQPEGDDEESIRRLGEGWVAEETLAIAIYAVARHIDSFEDALITAVNHDGDSDSTGAVAGNIMGAIVGYDAIPEKFKKNLELHNVILTIANDLHQGVCRTLTAGR